MAKKGQKFNKINLETKLEICRKHFEEYVPETPLAKEYDLPIGTIRYIFNNYRKGYGFERKKGIERGKKRKSITLEDWKERYEILKKYQPSSRHNERKSNIYKFIQK